MRILERRVKLLLGSKEDSWKGDTGALGRVVIRGQAFC